MGKLEEVEDGEEVAFTKELEKDNLSSPSKEKDTVHSAPGVEGAAVEDLLGGDDDDSDSPPLVFADSERVVAGITKQIIRQGEGGTPEKNATCFVHYRGWIAESNQKFQDTWQEKSPLELILGQEKPQLRGLAIAVGSMRARERSLFKVAWELGYGREGNFSFPHVPPMAELIYEVELIGFEAGKEGAVPRSMMTVEERIRAADNRKVDGNARFKEENFMDAMQQYEMALGYMNDDFMMQMYGKYRDIANAVRLPCLLNMAACHLKLLNYEDAIASCNLVLEEEENNTKALFRRGKARAALGQTLAALEDLKKANQLSPGDKAVIRELHTLADQEKEIQEKQKELYRGIFAPPAAESKRKTQQPWYLRLWAWIVSLFLMLWPFHKRRIKVD